MSGKGRVKVGIIGSQFQADIHADSFQQMPDEAEVVAVASPTPGNAEKLAVKTGASCRRCSMQDTNPLEQVVKLDYPFGPKEYRNPSTYGYTQKHKGE